MVPSRQPNVAENHQGLVIPALWAIARDPELLRQHSVKSVYLSLLLRLDPGQPRFLPNRATARALRIKPHTFSRALRVLTDHGYLERRVGNRRGMMFRLLFNPRPRADVPRNGTTNPSKT